MERWYVVQTKPRQEEVALENLERQGYRCFLPKIKQWQRSRGQRSLVEKSFFPSYLFIQLDTGKTNTAPIRSSRGVSRLVRFGNELVPVPSRVVMAIQQRSCDGVLELEKSFKPGQKVCIEDGALAGLEAIFQEKRGESRVILLLNMLGNEQRVELPITAIE